MAQNHTPDAFLDRNYPEGPPFFRKFLSSAEFTTPFLKSFDVKRKSSLKNKEGYADDIVAAIDLGELTNSEVIRRYVKKPRKWLSFKKIIDKKPFDIRQCPKLDSPETLLTSFGESGWYGPVIDDESDRVWYIIIDRIEHLIRQNTDKDKKDEQTTFETAYIRWPVVAEISQEYLALHWDGFSHSSQERPNSYSQFPFWVHISEAFQEIQEIIGGKWEHVNLSNLLLRDLWDKYNSLEGYTWSHKRVRAESAGIALNAHSSGDKEIDLEGKGLKGLSHTLAEAALEAIEDVYPFDMEKLSKMEEAILNTLVREWGTKSYEFTLRKNPGQEPQNGHSSNILEGEEQKSITIFQVHCYFGLNLLSHNQDALQHLRCFLSCRGSVGTLEFLMSKLSESKASQEGGGDAVFLPEQTELFG